ncbi:hydroxyisourate hydrolase [Nocardioides sp.]|uniref:hydroxyisourate hydrolase n=1 Tax=Nocardioides sp. TaxID=35761 RepID=UPI0035147A25
MRPTLSTHVLDAAQGRPAVGIEVAVLAAAGEEALAHAVTDDDGRVRFPDDTLPGPGTYRLVFATGPWFAAADRPTLFPAVELVVQLGTEPDIEPARPHHHVALLLSPFAYTTYRGS